MERNTHTIDATDKALGRLAVEVSCLLRGKHKPSFMPHKDEGDFVVVSNVDKMKITGKKMKQKIYYQYTGFIGNLKETTMEQLVAKKGLKEVLRKAVYGMMPVNKLRDNMIKRLKFVK